MYQKVVLSTTYTTLLSKRKKYYLRPFVVGFFLLYRNRNLHRWEFGCSICACIFGGALNISDILIF